MVLVNHSIFIEPGHMDWECLCYINLFFSLFLTFVKLQFCTLLLWKSEMWKLIISLLNASCCKWSSNYNWNINCIQFAALIINTAEVIRKILELFQLLHALITFLFATKFIRMSIMKQIYWYLNLSVLYTCKHFTWWGLTVME